MKGTTLAWDLHQEFDAISYLRAGDDSIKIRIDEGSTIPKSARDLLEKHGFKEDEEYGKRWDKQFRFHK